MDDPVRIIGAPTDYGANRRGVDMGPSAIRYAGLDDTLGEMGIDTEDAGDLLARGTEQIDVENDLPEGWNARYLRQNEDVCTRLAEEVEAAVGDGRFPLVLGGDHSIAMGTLRGASQDADVGAVWFDAHADFNTPVTSPSGNVHGMPLAAALGVGAFEDVEWAQAPGLSAENVVIVGLRSLDDTERPALVDSDVTVLPMPEVDERGIVDVTREALEVATAGVDGLHVSLDMDFLDPNEAPGVGTPVRGGVSYREAHAAMENVGEFDERLDVLRSMEIVEVNPILDSHNETAELATELAASALGKRIL
ncbi:arginase [Halobacteriales archaeon QS_8_69_26]|nr:MAG: arginase [Halobacteriales archaeon QS_8_69_26]